MTNQATQGKRPPDEIEHEKLIALSDENRRLLYNDLDTAVAAMSNVENTAKKMGLGEHMATRYGGLIYQLSYMRPVLKIRRDELLELSIKQKKK